MAGSIVVPVDGSRSSQRAATVAARLAQVDGAPVTLLSVATTGDREHGERAIANAVAAAGSAVVERRVVESSDVTAVILAELDRHPDDVLVLATSARGPVTQTFLGSISEDVLARTVHPVLLVGPHVDVELPIGAALVAAVHDERSSRILDAAVVDWHQRFGTTPWVVQVANDPRVHRSMESGLVHRVAESLRRRGVEAQWDVLHGDDVPRSLVEFTAANGGGIVAVASTRWTDPYHVHGASTARSLVRHSPYPVLVVPDRSPVVTVSSR